MTITHFAPVPANAKVHWYGSDIDPEILAAAVEPARTYPTQVYNAQPKGVFRSARKIHKPHDLHIRQKNDEPHVRDEDALLARRQISVERMNALYEHSMAEAFRQGNLKRLERLATLEIAQEFEGTGSLRNPHSRSDINRRIAVSEDHVYKGGYHIDCGEYPSLHSLPHDKTGFVNVYARQHGKLLYREMFFFGGPVGSPENRFISATMAKHFVEAAKADPENSIQVPRMPRTTDGFDTFSIYLRNMGGVGCNELTVNGRTYIPRDLTDRKRLWQHVQQNKVNRRDIHFAFVDWVRATQTNIFEIVRRKNTMRFSERGITGGIAYIHQAKRPFQLETIEQLDDYIIQQDRSIRFNMNDEPVPTEFVEMVHEIKELAPEIVARYPDLSLHIYKAGKDDYLIELIDNTHEQPLAFCESSKLDAFQNPMLTHRLIHTFMYAGPQRLTKAIEFMTDAPNKAILNLWDENTQKALAVGNLHLDEHGEEWVLQEYGQAKPAIINSEPIVYQDYVNQDYLPAPSEFTWVVKPKEQRIASMVETIAPVPGKTSYFGNPDNIYDDRIRYKGTLV